MKRKAVHYLYKITAPDGRAYIGVSKNPRDRFTKHCTAKSPIGEAIREHGRTNMRFEVIDSGEREHIYQLEADTIARLNTRLPNGFNLAPGGFGGRDPHPSTLAKLSAALVGKKLSSEHCASLAAARVGRKLSPEHVAKIASANRDRDRKLSPEHVAILSATFKGKPLSAEHCANIASACIGRKPSAVCNAARDAHFAHKRAEREAEFPPEERALRERRRVQNLRSSMKYLARKRAECEAARQLEAAE